MSFFASLRKKYLKRKSPINYWRSLGCKIGNGCEIYQSAGFGSEPYLVEIGDKVRINSGVNFITHDGGVWVVRNLNEDYKKG